MKTNDPVMTELWKAKEANAQRFGDLRTYVAHLAKQGKKPHPGGVVPAPARKPLTDAAGEA